MVKSETVKKGNKISKEFRGAQFEEISILRKGISALMVISNPNNYTSEQITEAENNLVKFEEYNTKVKNLLIP